VKNMGKYQAWDGGQFAVAAPSGTMVAQNVVSGIAPDDMTVVDGAWRGGTGASTDCQLGPTRTGARASGRVQAPAQPARSWSRPETHSTRRRKMGSTTGSRATPGPQEPSSSRLTRSRHRRHRRRGGSSWSLGPRGASARETSSRSSWLLRARKASR